MRKDKGETLVESLISMFFVTLAIVPLSNLFLKTLKINTKIDNINTQNIEISNMIELIKDKKYEEVNNFSGKYEISNTNDFYNKFLIEKKYQILKNIDFTKNKIQIKIEKTDGFYLNEKGEKEYIFKIIANKMNDYYFPNFL